MNIRLGVKYFKYIAIYKYTWHPYCYS